MVYKIMQGGGPLGSRKPQTMGKYREGGTLAIQAKIFCLEMRETQLEMCLSREGISPIAGEVRGSWSVFLPAVGRSHPQLITAHSYLGPRHQGLVDFL